MITIRMSDDDTEELLDRLKIPVVQIEPKDDKVYGSTFKMPPIDQILKTDSEAQP